jgi:hypothetical protein
MTNGELHDILDDANKKISLKEFRDILWQLKEDCFNEVHKLGVTNNNTHFYQGEINAFYIALDLSEHIEESDE